MKSPHDVKRKPTMLRLEPELYEKLTEIAKAESRSVNQQIIFYIRQGMDARGGERSA